MGLSPYFLLNGGKGMGTLSNLLRWKSSVTLRDEAGQTIIGEDGNPVIVWVRIITDKDLEDAFKKARIASAQMRASLLDENSDDYKAMIEPFDSATRDQTYEMCLAGLGANWVNEAISSVHRPDLVKLSDVAVDPDAPTLEEQERLDAENAKLEDKYQKALEEFIKIKQAEAESLLSPLTDEELKEKAKLAVVITVPLEIFLSELEDEKIWRAVYHDKECTIRGFTDVEDYRQTATLIKKQIKEVYDKLEAGHADIKN